MTQVGSFGGRGVCVLGEGVGGGHVAAFAAEWYCPKQMEVWDVVLFGYQSKGGGGDWTAGWLKARAGVAWDMLAGL